jgi:thymidine phosphorylase
LQKKVGDPISRGEALAKIFCSTDISSDYLREKIDEAIEITANTKPVPCLILKYINKDGQFSWRHYVNK